jgi:hypothetical protein
MKIFLLLFGLGVSLYVGAFWLPAVVDPPAVVKPPAVAQPKAVPLRGYDCALVTSIQIWTHEYRSLIHEEPLNYISLMISGWINPLFLVSMVLILIRRAQKAISILRIAILLMIPFCWIVFYNLKVRPLEGHFLWILGMVMVLFADRFRRTANRTAPTRA